MPARKSTAKPAARPAVAPAPLPLPLTHPAAIAAIVVAAACMAAMVTTIVADTDLWQHLLVGKVIWATHSVPTRQLWTWPNYGTPDVNPSWGFRTLLWPFWSLGGVWGLALWRWLTTLTAFFVLWAVARRMGSRGLTPLLVLVLGVLAYRVRAQVRPETLAAILLGLELWVLEARRNPRPGPRPRFDVGWWIVPISWVWINCHISYFLGFVLIAFHEIDALMVSLRRRRGGDAAPSRPGPGSLSLIGLSALAVTLINPFGWRALWMPFDYQFTLQQRLLYKIVYELRPLDWSLNQTNLLPLLVLAWPVLVVWRARRSGVDWAETLSCVAFTVMPFRSARFIGFYALFVTVYVARDLDEWVRARRWPAWTAPTWARAALVAAACVAAVIPESLRTARDFGVRLDPTMFPKAACDFMAAHGIKGRGFNKLELGGYLLYRFWPDRERLPFMDVHLSGSAADQELYARMIPYPDAWHELDRRYHFDYALIKQTEGRVGSRVEVDHVADHLDADSSWALVQLDDAGRLYVRRDGPLRDIAERFGCRVLPGGSELLIDRMGAAQDDAALRAALDAELARQASLSSENATANSLRSMLALQAGNTEASRQRMREVLAIRPHFPRGHEWLGRLDLADGRPRDALGEFERERRERGDGVPVDYWTGVAYQRLGDTAKASEYYKRELAKSGSPAARDSLTLIERANP